MHYHHLLKHRKKGKKCSKAERNVLADKLSNYVEFVVAIFKENLCFEFFNMSLLIFVQQRFLSRARNVLHIEMIFYL